MGKPSGKKKKQAGEKSGKANTKHGNSGEPSKRVFDEDASIFTDVSNELKEEGNKLFQEKAYEGAILKYDKAVKLLPKNHIDVAYLHSSLAACYMLMNPVNYQQAIDECNLALEVSPRYSKALLNRAKCYEALNRLTLAFKDVSMVLSWEPKNLTALETSERLRKGLEKKGIKLDDMSIISDTEPVAIKERVKEKTRRKKNHEAKYKADTKERKADVEEENSNNGTADKPVVKEDIEVSMDDCSNKNVQADMRIVKLVVGEDIRWGQLPSNCGILQLREIVRSRFPKTEAVLIKYKDKEGDLVTITSNEELRWAEESADPQGSLRLYITEVSPEHDPLWFMETKRGLSKLNRNGNGVSEIGSASHGDDKGSFYIDDWILRFAQLFQNHVGFNSEPCLDLHELGMKLFSEAIEDTVTSEEAQNILDLASEKFQEMAALALFNWGNIHMSSARKRLLMSEDASRESVLAQAKTAYEWAQKEYLKAGQRYEEALKLKPDFYEGRLALGQQQFEKAKLSWYFAIGNKVDLDKWPSSEVLELFNNAEDNIERGTQMFEDSEEERLKDLSKPDKQKTLLQQMGLDRLLKDLSTDEASQLASNFRSQVNLLWGTMLYEHSVVEFKLGLPMWEERLEAAIEKFEISGASQTDLAVIIKNHCSNGTTQEGLGFKIDEIVLAWNEMHDAKRWLSGVRSFRLEPLFRRRVPKLHQILENV